MEEDIPTERYYDEPSFILKLFYCTGGPTRGKIDDLQCLRLCEMIGDIEDIEDNDLKDIISKVFFKKEDQDYFYEYIKKRKQAKQFKQISGSLRSREISIKKCERWSNSSEELLDMLKKQIEEINFSSENKENNEKIMIAANGIIKYFEYLTSCLTKAQAIEIIQMFLDKINKAPADIWIETVEKIAGQIIFFLESPQNLDLRFQIIEMIIKLPDNFCWKEKVKAMGMIGSMMAIDEKEYRTGAFNEASCELVMKTLKIVVNAIKQMLLIPEQRDDIIKEIISQLEYLILAPGIVAYGTAIARFIARLQYYGVLMLDNETMKEIIKQIQISIIKWDADADKRLNLYCEIIRKIIECCRTSSQEESFAAAMSIINETPKACLESNINDSRLIVETMLIAIDLVIDKAIQQSQIFINAKIIMAIANNIKYLSSKELYVVTKRLAERIKLLSDNVYLEQPSLIFFPLSDYCPLSYAIEMIITRLRPMLFDDMSIYNYKNTYKNLINLAIENQPPHRRQNLTAKEIKKTERSDPASSNFLPIYQTIPDPTEIIYKIEHSLDKNKSDITLTFIKRISSMLEMRSSTEESELLIDAMETVITKFDHLKAEQLAEATTIFISLMELDSIGDRIICIIEEKIIPHFKSMPNKELFDIDTVHSIIKQIINVKNISGRNRIFLISEFYKIISSSFQQGQRQVDMVCDTIELLLAGVSKFRVIEQPNALAREFLMKAAVLSWDQLSEIIRRISALVVRNFSSDQQMSLKQKSLINWLFIKRASDIKFDIEYGNIELREQPFNIIVLADFLPISQQIDLTKFIFELVVNSSNNLYLMKLLSRLAEFLPEGIMEDLVKKRLEQIKRLTLNQQISALENIFELTILTPPAERPSTVIEVINFIIRIDLSIENLDLLVQKFTQCLYKNLYEQDAKQAEEILKAISSIQRKILALQLNIDVLELPIESKEIIMRIQSKYENQIEKCAFQLSSIGLTIKLSEKHTTCINDIIKALIDFSTEKEKEQALKIFGDELRKNLSSLNDDELDCLEELLNGKIFSVAKNNEETKKGTWNTTLEIIFNAVSSTGNAGTILKSFIEWVRDMIEQRKEIKNNLIIEFDNMLDNMLDKKNKDDLCAEIQKFIKTEIFISNSKDEEIYFIKKFIDVILKYKKQKNFLLPYMLTLLSCIVNNISPNDLSIDDKRSIAEHLTNGIASGNIFPKFVADEDNIFPEYGTINMNALNDFSVNIGLFSKYAVEMIKCIISLHGQSLRKNKENDGAKICKVILELIITHIKEDEKIAAALEYFIDGYIRTRNFNCDDETGLEVIATAYEYVNKYVRDIGRKIKLIRIFARNLPSSEYSKFAPSLKVNLALLLGCTNLIVCDDVKIIIIKCAISEYDPAKDKNLSNAIKIIARLHSIAREKIDDKDKDNKDNKHEAEKLKKMKAETVAQLIQKVDFSEYNKMINFVKEIGELANSIENEEAKDIIMIAIIDAYNLSTDASLCPLDNILMFADSIGDKNRRIAVVVQTIKKCFSIERNEKDESVFIEKFLLFINKTTKDDEEKIRIAEVVVGQFNFSANWMIGPFIKNVSNIIISLKEEKNQFAIIEIVIKKIMMPNVSNQEQLIDVFKKNIESILFKDGSKKLFEKLITVKSKEQLGNLLVLEENLGKNSPLPEISLAGKK
ncbi:MAG: hypothetical protein LBB09_02070 [Rickettsiales bacterium]|nr:hypothetical protein [Rickettsiales bacterium]